MKYGESDSLQEVKTWMEHQAYYLTEATVELAKERGKCVDSDKTRYGQGVFPWELRAPGVNKLANFKPELDWEPLRNEMKQHGVRNATLPMSLISTKESKAGSFTQVVPEYNKLKNKYQLMWDQTDCVGYLKTAAVLAAYVDQSISTNTFYNPAHFEGRKVPSTLIAKNLMLAHQYGLKTFYYSLINKAGSKMTEEVQQLTAQVEEILNEEDSCESCKL
jgi:ribonucleoside-diphosphate reductase alpha chain